MQFCSIRVAGARVMFGALAAFFFAAAAPAQAQVTLTRDVEPDSYSAGGTIDITLTLDVQTDAQINAAGVTETLPSDWTYVSIVSGTAPNVTPTIGESGDLEFAWFPPPAAGSYPISFTYRMAIAGEATGTAFLTGSALVLIQGQGEVSSGVATTVVVRQGEGPFHSADYDFSGTVSLQELLRVIQFFNIGGLHCADSPDATVDGFAAGLLGSKACAFHNSDYIQQDWRIGLQELLRLIQFFNLGGYFACEGTPDGYCAN